MSKDSAIKSGFKAVVPYLALEVKGKLRAVEELYVQLFRARDNKSLGTFWVGKGGQFEPEEPPKKGEEKVEKKWDELWKKLSEDGFHGLKQQDAGPNDDLPYDEQDDADLVRFFLAGDDTDDEPDEVIWLPPDEQVRMSLHDGPPKSPFKAPNSQKPLKLQQGKLGDKSVYYFSPPPPFGLHLRVELEVPRKELDEVSLVAVPVPDGGQADKVSSKGKARMLSGVEHDPTGDPGGTNEFIDGRLEKLEVDKEYAVFVCYTLKEPQDKDEEKSREFAFLVWQGKTSVRDLVHTE